MRRRVIGKDLDDPEVRVELTNEANRLKSQKVKRGVTRLLEGVPSEQRDLPARAKENLSQQEVEQAMQLIYQAWESLQDVKVHRGICYT